MDPKEAFNLARAGVPASEDSWLNVALSIGTCRPPENPSLQKELDRTPAPERPAPLQEPPRVSRGCPGPPVLRNTQRSSTPTLFGRSSGEELIDRDSLALGEFSKLVVKRLG